jgi:SAM-dependent methyltransferase
MEHAKTLTNYNQNASDYDRFRRPSPNIVEVLRKAFIDADHVLSIGCGTGQYAEAFRRGKNIVGLDMSFRMLSISKTRIQHTVCGNMLSLPFKNNIFDGIYFIQSLHHIGANLQISEHTRNESRKRAISEAKRVLQRGPFVIVQRDPSQNQAVWFWKYFPKALETKLIIQPRVSTILSWLEESGLDNIKATAIDDPMIQGFYEPTAPLDPGFRRSFSEFSYLTDEDMAAGVRGLQEAIESGAVYEEIEECKRNFKKIGGTVFAITAIKV